MRWKQNSQPKRKNMKKLEKDKNKNNGWTSRIKMTWRADILSSTIYKLITAYLVMKLFKESQDSSHSYYYS